MLYIGSHTSFLKDKQLLPSFAVDLNLNTTLTQLSTAIFYVKFLYFLVVQLVYNVI